MLLVYSIGIRSNGEFSGDGASSACNNYKTGSRATITMLSGSSFEQLGKVMAGFRLGISRVDCVHKRIKSFKLLNDVPHLKDMCSCNLSAVVAVFV